MRETSKSTQKKTRDRVNRISRETDKKALSYFDIQGKREVKVKKAVADRIVEKYFHHG